MRQRNPEWNLEAELSAYAAANPGSKAAQWSEHLSRWPVYAAATGAALAMATSAEANTIVTGSAIFHLDINLGGGNTAELGNVTFGGLGSLGLKIGFAQISSPGILLSTRGVAEAFEVAGGGPFIAGGLLARFNTGASIGGSQLGLTAIQHEDVNLFFIGLDSDFNTGFGAWQSGSVGFAGFKLSNGDLGWIQLEWSGEYPGYPSTLDPLDWAVNTVPGGPIAAGQISNPEPGTLPLSLVALGSAGILAWRRSRRGRAIPAEPQR